MQHARRLCAAVCLLLTMIATQAARAEKKVDPEYWKVVTERADKIVVTLDLSDAEQTARIRDTIAQQYVDLARIHDGGDALIAELRDFCGDDSQSFEPAAQAIRNAAEVKLAHLHHEFVAKLASELTAEQVEAVKDGLTYGVVNVTYKGYLEMLPDLTDEQKRTIKGWLIEAREHAMDAGSSDKKHWWFGKYKGRINNYLSAQGYDLKQAEKDWRKRLQSESQSNK